MKVTADTNILVRAILGDDARQSQLAQTELEQAELVAITLPALCELVRVLPQGYKIPVSDIGDAIRRLMNSANVAINRPAVESGARSAQGWWRPDGVMAFEDAWLGAETFLSFDKKAARLIKEQGGNVHLLS